MAVTRDTLNDVMDFDHVVRVHDDGTVTDEPDTYAPELFDEQVSDGWELMDGYSGQDGYSGPIMHPSEYIGGRLADDILAQPGVYVALVAYASEEVDNEDADSNEVEEYGWAVARKIEL